MLNQRYDKVLLREKKKSLQRQKRKRTENAVYFPLTYFLVFHNVMTPKKSINAQGKFTAVGQLTLTLCSGGSIGALYPNILYQSERLHTHHTQPSAAQPKAQQ